MKLARILFAFVIVSTLAIASHAEEPAAPQMVHIVLFTMKKDAPADEIEKTITDCHELLGKIPAVKSLKAGRPSKSDGSNLVKKNYDLALVIFVADQAGLDEYTKHPDHLKFVEKHGKYFDVDKLQAFDFMNQKK